MYHHPIVLAALVEARTADMPSGRQWPKRQYAYSYGQASVALNDRPSGSLLDAGKPVG